MQKSGWNAVCRCLSGGHRRWSCVFRWTVLKRLQLLLADNLRTFKSHCKMYFVVVLNLNQPRYLISSISGFICGLETS